MSNLQDPSCIDCGSGGEIHQHHVVPRSLGGTFMVPLCSKCHALVHSREELSIKALTSAAMQAKRKRGEFTGGTVPFGKRLATCGVMLEDEPAEQSILADIAAMQASGLSLRAIADELNASGVTRRDGASWHHVAVSRAIKGAAYQDETEANQ